MTRLWVVDASVVVDLLGRFEAAPIEEILFERRAVLAAPELLDIEVLHTLRRLDLLGALPASRRITWLDDFQALRIRRFRHAPLWHEVWRLRENLTAYDATYVALAQALGSSLLTRDERLARVQGLGIEVVVP